MQTSTHHSNDYRWHKNWPACPRGPLGDVFLQEVIPDPSQCTSDLQRSSGQWRHAHGTEHHTPCNSLIAFYYMFIRTSFNSCEGKSLIYRKIINYPSDNKNLNFMCPAVKWVHTIGLCYLSLSSDHCYW